MLNIFRHFVVQRPTTHGPGRHLSGCCVSVEDPEKTLVGISWRSMFMFVMCDTPHFAIFRIPALAGQTLNSVICGHAAVVGFRVRTEFPRHIPFFDSS